MIKKYIDENVYIIEDFLSEDELSALVEHSQKEDGWFERKNGEIKNIFNKCIEGPDKALFECEGGIFEKLESLLNKDNIQYNRAYILQKFKKISSNEDFALPWHYENEHDNAVAAGFIIYLNDDFEGGELIFKNKDFTIKPKKNMFIYVPPTSEYEHCVLPHSGTDRMTFYGSSFYNSTNRVQTSIEYSQNMNKAFLNRPNVVINESISGNAEIVNEDGSYILYVNGEQWNVMNLEIDSEFDELYSMYDMAKGKVLLTGLGFGSLALWLLKKESVEEVTVLEISQDVIDLFVKNNLVPENLKIICTDALSYSDNKHYDCLFLDHYERQNFNWRIKNMLEVSSRISHDVFWAWSLEDAYCIKKYLNKDQRMYRTRTGGRQYRSYGDIHKVFQENSNFKLKWIDFVKENFNSKESLLSINLEKINEYVYTYFHRYDA